jgi:hypothetical protein
MTKVTSLRGPRVLRAVSQATRPFQVGASCVYTVPASIRSVIIVWFCCSDIQHACSDFTLCSSTFVVRKPARLEARVLVWHQYKRIDPWVAAHGVEHWAQKQLPVLSRTSSSRSALSFGSDLCIHNSQGKPCQAGCAGAQRTEQQGA